MEPSRRCEVCGTTAGAIVDRWGTAPCLLRLDTPNVKCLEHIILEAYNRKKEALRRGPETP